MRRSKFISNELTVLVTLGLCTNLISVVAGDQQPCAGLITKPYMRGSAAPCENSPDLPPVNLDPASDMKMATTVEANLPARRKLSSGDTAGSVAGITIIIIIIVAIIWCCCTDRCGCGRRVVVVTQPDGASQSQAQAHNQTVNSPVTVSNNMQMPEQKPTVQYTVVNYGAAQHPVPTPGVGELEMLGSIVATANAGNNAFAHAGVASGGPPAPGQAVPGAPGSPAPGFPAYTHPAPPAQHNQYPSPLSNYPSDKEPAASPLSSYPVKRP